MADWMSGRPLGQIGCWVLAPGLSAVKTAVEGGIGAYSRP